MQLQDIIEALERTPVIAATDSRHWQTALSAEPEVLFHLNVNLLTAKAELAAAKEQGKIILVHIDLADGIGKDKTGIQWLAKIGADGIISTRSHLIKAAKDLGLCTVQRFFALDSKGMDSIRDTAENTASDLIEIMPGVIPKAIARFADTGIPVIAGGLIETKAEVTAALGNGALAVSTGQRSLWTL